MFTNDRRVTAHIPGGKHNVRRHCKVLVRGGGARDIPGTSYRCIRGPYDCAGHPDKTKRRSIYGVPSRNRRIRRKFRSITGSL